MSILTGKEICQKYYNREIYIDDFSLSRVNPNSYNLRLAPELAVYENHELDMKKENTIKYIDIPDEGFVLQPGILYLGRTLEMTRTSDVVPMLEGRSSIGRLGMSIHVTAGFGDIGFKGYWTLEITVTQPLRIYPNVEICQIYYHTVNKDMIDMTYDEEKNGKYNFNTGIQPSLLYKDFY